MMSRAAIRLILATSMLVLAILVAVFGVNSAIYASRVIADSAQWQMASVANVVALGGDVDEIRDAVSRTDLGRRGSLAVWLPDGSVVGLGHADAETIARYRSGPASGEIALGDGHSAVLPVRLDGARIVVIEAFTAEGATVRKVWGEVLGFTLLGLIAIGLALVTAHFLLRRPLADVQALRRAAMTLERGDTQEQLHITGPAELAAVADSLNHLSERVQSLVVREREMVADLSHRMRTPLTALRLDADSIGPGPLADRIRLAVATLDHNLADVIKSATSSEPPGPSACDAAAVIRERMRFWATLAGHQNRPCRFTNSGGEAKVALAASDLAAVLDALVTNVFQHTRTSVPLLVTLVKHAGWVSLVVEDGGTGIANIEGALRRGGSGRGSTGLGLAIAKEATAANGGTLRLDRGQLGGARIHLRFSELGVEHSPRNPLACRILPHYS